MKANQGTEWRANGELDRVTNLEFKLEPIRRSNRKTILNFCINVTLWCVTTRAPARRTAVMVLPEAASRGCQLTPNQWRCWEQNGLRSKHNHIENIKFRQSKLS